MADQPTGPVGDFCAELRRLVRACAVAQKDIAKSLEVPPSSVSELLGGRRRTPPEWDVVRGVVELCARRQPSSPVALPPGVRLDTPWWKARYENLIWVFENGPVRSIPEPRSAAVRVVTELPEATDVFAASAMDASGAVLVLTGGDGDLAYALKKQLSKEGETAQALGVLLDRFPERVRAAHGVRRAALLQAARVVLVSVAVADTGVRPFVEGGRRSVTGGAARAYGWPVAAGEPDEAPALPADPALRQGIELGRIESPDDRRLLHTYVSLAGPLAAECPEFALAAGLPGCLDSERAGLAGLGSTLGRFADRADLLPAARPLLDGPITDLDVRGPVLPSLADGYVNPRYRLAGPGETNLQQGAASDKWWRDQPLHDDIERFLAAHLIGLPALLSPLIVLGHPGAGKSLLTKLLTTRLPAREFRALRVELRHTPADADVQTQLEHALRRATGRSEAWPDWAEHEPDSIPVVLLDGFDELLQAGAQRLDAARQFAYLRDVEWFQRREAEAGRPLVVVVTSRTVVAARAEIPEQSPVLRLEPFDTSEIERWLAAWNETNLHYLERHGLRSLSLDALAPHRDLAAHPLLLLMLALYDADDNALYRGRDENISRTELYDRLLTTFVRRQLVKDGPLPASVEQEALDRELHRLSVIALGMFQRGAQAIAGGQAEDDLRALADGGTGDDLLFGRFFFVHEAQAVVAEQRLRSYEFMHATFGEHLTARLIERALRRLPSLLPDDGELYALLSYTPLTDRAQVVQDLTDMIAGWERGQRSALPGLLAVLFREAPWETPHRGGPAYAPARRTRAHQDAVYTANLLLIAVLASGELDASNFLGPDDLADRWRRQALVWQSQMSPESWDLYTSALQPGRIWSRDDVPRQDLRLGMRRVPVDRPDLSWPLGFPESGVLSTEPGPEAVRGTARRVLFVGDRDAELLLDVARPVLQQLPSALRVHPVDREGAIRSVGQTVAALLLHDPRDPAALPGRFLSCLGALTALPPEEAESVLGLVCERLAYDVGELSDKDLRTVLERLNRRLRGGLRPPRPTLANCVGQVLGRGDHRLGEQAAALIERAVRHMDLVTLTRAGRSARFWHPLHGVCPDDLDALFDACLPDPTEAARHPHEVVELLRLAIDLGLTDWLAAHVAELLVLLPDNAFDLLRPCDLGPLREALPDGGYDYEKEFRQIEESYRPYTARSPASAESASGSPSPPGSAGS
ncbi:NACHT domain-containing protein [Streptomyces sp. YKOK-I1]